MSRQTINDTPLQYQSDDTIIALASGRGAAGVAVIRLSGPAAIAILRQVFRPRRTAPVDFHNPAETSRLIYGTIVDREGVPLDDCLVVAMPAPRTFTGEDVAEIQCHGSPAVIARILETCIAAGARPAEPGEFSRRAFLNGKMDLAQAEALSDLIAANSEAARRLALRQLRGGLSARIRRLNSDLIDAAAEIEAHLDFPDEDIPELTQTRVSERMQSALADMRQLLAGHDKARLRQEGARVILAGEPNAGKSSLFNALVGRERAIVSPHPGTTRDTIEAVIEIGGLAVTLVDTAGIRESTDEIERIGIDRTQDEIAQADLILHLSENPASPGGQPFWPRLEGADPSRVIPVWTKRDHCPPGTAAVAEAHASEANPYIEVSTATGHGLADLEACLRQHLPGVAAEEESSGEMSRVRQAESLRKAVESTERAFATFSSGESGDLVMVDLRDALMHVGEIIGERLDEQILDRIFSTFCLGK